jgi:hypothetical protein
MSGRKAFFSASRIAEKATLAAGNISDFLTYKLIRVL